MPEHTKEEIGRSLTAYIYEILTMDPSGTASSLPDRNFISWCAAIPFKQSDFLHLQRGTSSDVPIEGQANNAANDARERVDLAADWSRFCNFIPTADGVYDKDQQKAMFNTKAFSQDGSSVVTVYDIVLNNSQVPTGELSEEQKERVDRLRSALEVKVEKRDWEGNVTIEPVDSQLVTAYETYANEYDDALAEYNAKQILAQNSDDPRDVYDWQRNAGIYRRRLRRAYNKWVSAGYKNEYESINAALNQIGKRSLQRYKEQLLETFELAGEATDTDGFQYYPTGLIPRSLPFNENWPEYSFSESLSNTYYNKETNNWDVNATVPIWNWFWVQPDVGGSREPLQTEVNTSNFTMRFKLATGTISRPWLDMFFLQSDLWRWEPSMENTSLGAPLSDGGSPPEGRMVAVPTRVIMARDVYVEFESTADESSQIMDRINAGGSISIGPFQIGRGKYERGNTVHETSYERQGRGILMKDIQVIGFMNKVLPALPNPSPAIPDEKWG